MNHLQHIPLKRIDGQPASLADFQGKVVLIVNVASKCGLTPQYEALQALYDSKQRHGLEILGFPANDFKGQEPGEDQEIQQFCSLNYGVQFPLFSKISVRGSTRHPLYTALIEAQPHSIGEGPHRERMISRGNDIDPAPGVLWNFEKFLLDRQGRVVARFAPDVKADDTRLLEVIEAELAKA